MPRVVTASHPSEADLLNLAAGREAPGLEACRRHLDEGCRLCDARLSELAELVESVREEEAFNAILEGDGGPAIPEDFAPKPLPFQLPKPQLDEIYRVARNAEGLADDLLTAARESDDKLDAALTALYGNPSRGFALLYACQKGMTFVGQDPIRGLELARRIFEEAQTLMDANTDVRISTPAPRESVQAEAKLLESFASLQLGHARESAAAAAAAREFFRAAGDMGFGKALADYYEGQAASFARDFVSSERLLRKALKVFAEFGQDHLMGRAEAALGTLHLLRGDANRALSYLEHAIESLDPEEDGKQLASALNNRAQALLRLGRFDMARAYFARALGLARKLEARAVVQNIRNGLAELDFRRGHYDRALRAFGDLATEAATAGWEMEELFAQLYVAECLGRLGRQQEMVEEIVAVRIGRRANPFAPSPAMEELFDCLDLGMLDADLVAHVRGYLQDEANGSPKAYQPLRLAS
jgi:tetratricopeptide (TPR) repeat protein